MTLPVDPKAPTSTEDWLRCPMYAVYRKRWQQRGGWTPHRLLGSAIAAGLAAARKGGDMIAVANAASAELTQGYIEQDEWTFEGLGTLLDKGLAKALTTDMLAEGTATVVSVEQWMAHSKVDLVTRHPDGLVVTDDKVHLELERRYLPSRLKDWDVSHQLHHECWAASAHYGEPVAYGRIHIIVLTPKPWTYLHLVPMGAERLEAWYASATHIWHAMDAPPYRRPEGCTKYGGCPFHIGCWQLHGDETRFPAVYEPAGG